MVGHSLLQHMVLTALLGWASLAQDDSTTEMDMQLANQTTDPTVTSVTSDGAVVLSSPVTEVEKETVPHTGTRCQGYYDVMGQWDPPFNCNAGIFLYCCGTCFYRFCCQFHQQRLDQTSCSNYDTPIWANTGKPVDPITELQSEHERDRTHLIVYLICGVVAVMVLVGIFTKLGLERRRGRPNNLGTSRNLQELLKPPGGEVNPVDRPRSSSPTRANGVSARALRGRSNDRGPGSCMSSTHLSSTYAQTVAKEQYHLNNAAFTSCVSAAGFLHPQSHSNLPGLVLSKYNSLKAVADTAARGYYKSYPLMDFSQHPNPPVPFKPLSVQPKNKSYLHQSKSYMHQDKSYMHQDKSYMHQAFPTQDIHSPLSISIPASQLDRIHVHKAPTQSLLSSSAFRTWDSRPFRTWDSRPKHVHRQISQFVHSNHQQTYGSRRQYSTETLPEIFLQPMAYGASLACHYPPRQKAYQTSSKTEVTV